jgi:eukaryotic-like serine/threonine-protein kinase
MIPPELPALIGGKYRPLAVIGEGAMGIVYSVEHTLTGEHLALKVMTAHHGATRDAIERFKREARASAKIKSEHVVRVIDADVAPELGRAPYLVMDLLDGADLEKASGDRPMEPDIVLEWLRQIARVLDKAHRLGITHRDLKPENLFLTHREDGAPLIKILDFGIAKIAAESTGTTQSGQILGTPLYMSPEQARGDAGLIGPSADLYALGLIAYKLLVGAPYWNATSVAGIIGQVLYEPMPPPSSRGCWLGTEFDQWFLRACSRDAANRFGSAVEEVETLAKVLGLPVENRADVLRSNPGESGNAIGGRSQPGGSSGAAVVGSRSADPSASPTIAQSGGTLVSSSREMPEIRTANAARRRRNLFYAVMSVAALLSILVVVYYRQDSPAASIVLPAPAAAVANAAPAVVVMPPAVLAPAPSDWQAEPTSAPKGAAGSAVAPAISTRRRDPPKALPAHSGSVATQPRPDRASVNDPLGDQK